MQDCVRSRVPLVIALAAVCWISAIRPAADAQTPLEQQRQRSHASTGGAPPFTGRVVSTSAGIIFTTILPDLSSTGMSDGAVLRVRLAGRTFSARFLSPQHYSQVVTDPATRKGLDVDVACTVDQKGGLAVIGLGGGLPEWLGIKPGAPISVEKP